MAEQRDFLEESGGGEGLASLYVVARETRALDERLLELQRLGEIPFHAPCHGREVCAAGAVAALETGDWISPGLQAAPFLLARGMDMEQLVHRAYGTAGAEGRGLGSEAGWAEGRVLSVSPGLGTWIVQATGFARAAMLAGRGEAILVGFGDGCVAVQDFHTGLNFGGLWKVPAVYLWYSHPSRGGEEDRKAAASEVDAVAAAYGIRGAATDGADPLAVRSMVAEALERARAGDGPTLLRASLPGRFDAGGEQDPLRMLRLRLEAEGAWDEGREEALAAEIAERLDEAVGSARSGERPAAGRIFDDVYAEPPAHLCAQRDAMGDEDR